mgnify:CR=1 FL=1|tara:strand:- start:15143 stop:16108 length:966 start_codon:yes stop_codon:yes gene_type:complete
MAILFGRGSFAKLAPEASYASTGAYKTNAIRIIDASLQTTQQRDGRSHLTTSDGAIRTGFFDVFKESGGSITVPVYFEGSTLLLKAMIGSIATTGGPTNFTHKLKSSTTDLDSFTLGLSRGSDANGYEVFKGCMVSSGTLSLNAGEEMQLSLDLIAQDSAARTTQPTPTYNASQKQIYHYEVTTDLSFDSQSYKVRSFELTVENSLERRNVLGSKLTLSPDVTDYRTVTISVELDAETNALYNAMLAGTESSVLLKVTETGGTNYMEIQLKNAIITDYSDPLSTVGRLSQSVTFTGLASSTAEALQIEIQNTLNAANALNT